MANYLGDEPDKTRPEGRQVVCYGAPFVGKTTSLADPDIKVLLCDMDHNTSPLDDASNVTIFPINSFEEYQTFKEAVHRGYFEINKKKISTTDFDVIAFDSFTRFEELIKSWVPRVYAPKRSREIDTKFGAQSDWEDLQNREVQEIRDWQAMTRTHGFCVIWLGHDMTMINDATKKAQRIQLALQGKYASPRIMSAVDAVVYMAKEEVMKDNKKTLVRGIYTQQQGIIQADVRLTLEKRAKLAEFIPTVKWSKILPFLGWIRAKK